MRVSENLLLIQNNYQSKNYRVSEENKLSSIVSEIPTESFQYSGFNHGSKFNNNKGFSIIEDGNSIQKIPPKLQRYNDDCYDDISIHDYVKKPQYMSKTWHIIFPYILNSVSNLGYNF